MVDEHIEKQKELFEEFQKPEKKFRFFKGNNNKFLQDRPFLLQFSVEKLIFYSIGILLVVIVIFCLGVEQGKNIINYKKPIAVQNQAPIQQAPKQQVQAVGPVVTKVIPRAVVQPKITKGTFYSIRIATYANKDFADKDILKIKQMNLPVYIIKSGKFFVINVGDYADRQAAEAAFSMLKKYFSGIYIKTITK